MKRSIALLFATSTALLAQDAVSDVRAPSVDALPDAASATESKAEFTPAAKKSSNRGLKWLLSAQNEDGSWGEDEKSEPEVACTAIAGLSLLASGETGRDGAHRDAVVRAARWIAKRASAAGREMKGAPSSIETYLGTHIGDYLSCAFLAEASGMVPQEEGDPSIGAALRRLSRRIEGWQSRDGSWNDGIEPLTTTAIAYVALRSAHNAGVAVEKASLQRVIDYVEKRIDTERKVLLDPVHGDRERFTGTSGALRVLLGLGREMTKEAETASGILQRLPFGRDYGDEVSGEDFFGGLLAAHALIHEEGDAWRKVFSGISKTLVDCQNADGSWTGHHCISARTFCTACAVTTLVTPLRFLPMIQM